MLKRGGFAAQHELSRRSGHQPGARARALRFPTTGNSDPALAQQSQRGLGRHLAPGNSPPTRLRLHGQNPHRNGLTPRLGCRAAPSGHAVPRPPGHTQAHADIGPPMTAAEGRCPDYHPSTPPVPKAVDKTRDKCAKAHGGWAGGVRLNNRQHQEVTLMVTLEKPNTKVTSLRVVASPCAA